MQNTRTTDALQSLHAGLQLRLHVHEVLKNLNFLALAGIKRCSKVKKHCSVLIEDTHQAFQ